ncbi:MAG TPA: hypothetical protein VFQ61_25625 [Polyangiaceae bacterium]|nr:hypothetical protein [Polyangiaceae bacterium]
MRWLSAFVIGLCTTWSGFAVAQNPEPAATPSASAAQAEALFNEGRKLVSAGKFAEACPKFEQSERLDPALGTLLNLADCFERVGRVGSAYRGFLDAAARAESEGYSDAVRGARERAEALAPQVPKLVVIVPTQSNLRVTQDGQTLEPASWGQPIPVDPGAHHIAASAPGKQPWETNVVMEKGATKTVQVPELGEGASSAAGVALEPSDAVSPGSFQWTGARIGAVAAGGVGVVGIGLGTFFGLKSMSKRDDAEKHCTGSTCTDDEGVELRSDARAAGNASTVAFAAGAVALAAGAVLWFTARDAEAPTAGLRVGPTSVALTGSF